MRKLLAALFLTTVLLQPALASDNETERIVELLHKKLPNLHFLEVKPSPIKGLYEIHAGPNIIYIDRDVTHLVFGALYDLKGQNLTDLERRALFKKLAAEMSKKFPKSAIHIDGKTKPTLYLVVDPDCPYSRALLKRLLSKDVDMYLIFLSFHRHSFPHVVYLLESKDKKGALSLVVNRKLDDEEKVQEILKKNKDAKEKFTKLLDEWKNWADNYGIRGVPFAIVPKYQQVIAGFRMEKYDSLYPVDVKSIDLKTAPIVIGHGKKKVIAVEDPTCPFCKRMEELLKPYIDKGEVTLYVYLLPIHGDYSMKAIADIMNEKEKRKRGQLLSEFFEGKRPSGKPMNPEAEKEFKEQLKVVNKLGVSGTPTFISVENGKKIVGADLHGFNKVILGEK